jgi:hypothetical protein
MKPIDGERSLAAEVFADQQPSSLIYIAERW